MKELLEKGDFKKIDEAFLTQSLTVFQDITKIQQKYNKLDTDTFINEVRDSMTAKYLKYTHINIAKHGLDAKRQSKNSVLKLDFLASVAPLYIQNFSKYFLNFLGNSLLIFAPFCILSRVGVDKSTSSINSFLLNSDSISDALNSLDAR
jgi:hypothetical protein